LPLDVVSLSIATAYSINRRLSILVCMHQCLIIIATDRSIGYALQGGPAKVKPTYIYW